MLHTPQAQMGPPVNPQYLLRGWLSEMQSDGLSQPLDPCPTIFKSQARPGRVRSGQRLASHHQQHNWSDLAVLHCLLPRTLSSQGQSYPSQPETQNKATDRQLRMAHLTA